MSAAFTSNELIDRVAACLERHGVAPGTSPVRVTVALSGGRDSMCLLDAAATLRARLPLALDVLHVHHGLSPHADAWADFCTTACAAREVPLHVARVTVDRTATDGLGVEGAARRARYDAFARHAGPIILAAHHLDDQAETVLHQLLRGTGLSGMAAMGEARLLDSGQCLLRPWLEAPGEALDAYAAARGLHWVEDESNRDCAYTRNALRHELLPRIAARFPHYRESLSRAARHAAEHAGFADALARIDLAWDGSRASAVALDRLPPDRQTNALYHLLKWHGAAAPSHAQLGEWARQLFRPAPAGKPHRAGGHGIEIRRQRDQLSVETSHSRSD